MTATERRDDDLFHCTVRFSGDPSSDFPEHEIRRLVRSARARGRAWGASICSYLGTQPHDPLTITLAPGVAVSRTRGGDIVVAVTPGVISAALSHELVHAIAGRSPLPLHGEGLAVHVDATLRLAGPTWPFFDLPPDRWVQSFVEDDVFVPLAELIAEPPVQPTDGDAMSRAARFYVEAGSFVGYLVDRLGTKGYWPYFRSGRLPGDVASLEAGWLAHLGGSVTEEERRLGLVARARFEDNAQRAIPRAVVPVGLAWER